MCEKCAAEHEAFISSHRELMNWIESCRQQLDNSDSKSHTADYWVCILCFAVVLETGSERKG